MKIIHISDLHIDSKMETNFSPIQARERNNEILVTLENLFNVMEENDYSAMIIAGDMFDTKKISQKSFLYVLELIKKHNTKKFFYVSGNHDSESLLLSSATNLPTNLILFENNFTSVMLSPNICIGGLSLSTTNHSTFSPNIAFDENNINIMIMHGELTKVQSKTNNQTIYLGDLKDKNIDYLALGHIHSYSSGKIDKRCEYVYPGCLEPRGYDEIGEKGYVSIEINEQTHKITHSFVPFSKRTFFEESIDITNIKTSRGILDAIYSSFKNAQEKDIVRVILTGKFSTGTNKSVRLMEEELNSRYYAAKIIDKSKLQINPEDYEGDISLKGCFIKSVLSSKLNDEEKADVIELGLKALSGEDIY